MTPGFLERSASIFPTQEPHVIPAMESVHDRTGSSDAIPEAVVRGAIAGSLEETISADDSRKMRENYTVRHQVVTQVL